MIVQVDETILNLKCKTYRGRSTVNKTNALYMIEYNREIMFVYVTMYNDMKLLTILSYLCENVVNNTEIHSDEHLSYKSLSKNGFIHKSVCHKYEFVNSETGANTQAIESFHNCLLLETKKVKESKQNAEVSF